MAIFDIGVDAQPATGISVMARKTARISLGGCMTECSAWMSAENGRIWRRLSPQDKLGRCVRLSIASGQCELGRAEVDHDTYVVAEAHSAKL